MPRSALKLFSPLEWKVMNIVWNKNSCSPRDVYLRVGELYHWAPNTVRTYLNRLMNKGFLNATLICNAYLNRPKRTVEQALFQVADVLMDNRVAKCDRCWPKWSRKAIFQRMT